MCVSVCGLLLVLPTSHSWKNVIAALQADGCQKKNSERAAEAERKGKDDKGSAGHEGE